MGVVYRAQWWRNPDCKEMGPTAKRWTCALLEHFSKKSLLFDKPACPKVKFIVSSYF